VVVLVVSCANAMLSATVQAAPPTNILINLVCFIIVLCFG